MAGPLDTAIDALLTAEGSVALAKRGLVLCRTNSFHAMGKDQARLYHNFFSSDKTSFGANDEQ